MGFLWPGYLCFKDIESESDNLKKWCIYWCEFELPLLLPDHVPAVYSLSFAPCLALPPTHRRRA